MPEFNVKPRSERGQGQNETVGLYPQSVCLFFQNGSEKTAAQAGLFIFLHLALLTFLDAILH